LIAGAVTPFSTTRFLLRLLLGALVVIVLARVFVLETFRIAANSMSPELAVGDRILVVKTSYGLRLPFARAESVRWSAPARGDVIAFRLPTDESREYVKRVIAVPGDTIEIHGIDVWVNGDKLPRRPIDNPESVIRITGRTDFDGVLFREDNGGASYWVEYTSPDASVFRRNVAMQRVPDDAFYVMGDNRDNSDDSRSFGPVARTQVDGSVRRLW